MTYIFVLYMNMCKLFTIIFYILGFLFFNITGSRKYVIKTKIFLFANCFKIKLLLKNIL